MYVHSGSIQRVHKLCVHIAVGYTGHFSIAGRALYDTIDEWMQILHSDSVLKSYFTVFFTSEMSRPGDRAPGMLTRMSIGVVAGRGPGGISPTP